MQSSTDITPSVQPQSQAQHQQAYNMSSTMSDDPTTSKENLEHLRTTTASIPISPGLAEKLYLRSGSADGRLELTTVSSAGIENDWRKRLGNPASIGVLGFVVCLTPLSMDLMGWRGAGGSGAAQVASYYFVGGMLSLISGLLEFLLGNTFTFVVFSSFAGFWMALGGTLTPSFNAIGAYSSDGLNTQEGAASRGFNASFGFYILAWGLLTFIFFICSLRTNVVFATLFLSLDVLFGLLAGAYLCLADGQSNLAGSLTIAAGAFGLVSCAAGWYALVGQLLDSLDFPVQLPVGDLSRFIVSASERRSRRKGPGNVVDV